MGPVPLCALFPNQPLACALMPSAYSQQRPIHLLLPSDMTTSFPLAIPMLVLPGDDVNIAPLSVETHVTTVSLWPQRPQRDCLHGLCVNSVPPLNFVQAAPVSDVT